MPSSRTKKNVSNEVKKFECFRVAWIWQEEIFFYYLEFSSLMILIGQCKKLMIYIREKVNDYSVSYDKAIKQRIDNKYL